MQLFERFSLHGDSDGIRKYGQSHFNRETGWHEYKKDLPDQSAGRNLFPPDIAGRSAGDQESDQAIN